MGELAETEKEEEMRKKLKCLERTRDFTVWLDNSTVANHGYLYVVCLVVVHPKGKAVSNFARMSGTKKIETTKIQTTAMPTVSI